MISKEHSYLSYCQYVNQQRLSLEHMSDLQCVYIAMTAIVIKYEHDENRKRISGTKIFTPLNSIHLVKGQRLSFEYMSDF